MKGVRAEEQQLTFVFPTVMTPLGDGSFRLTPGRPVAEMTPLKAAQFLGVSRSSVYRLLDEGVLTARRPTRGKILISAECLAAHREQTKDAEYWHRTAEG